MFALTGWPDALNSMRAMDEEPRVIDWEQMDMIADGYTPEFVEIFREFAGEIPGLFNTLDGHYKANDTAKAARVAHQIKGSSANFGFVGVSAPMAAVETAAKEGSLEGAPARLDQARANFERARAELLETRGVRL